MKNWLFRRVPAVLVFALAACGGGGDSSPPPANVVATAGDNYIQVRWDAAAGVDYFVFTAVDASLTTLNWLNLPGGAAYVNVVPPLTLCAHINGQPRWFTVNGRTGSAPGGPGSPVVSATPRSAGGAWSGGATLADDLGAIGFAGSTTCQRSGLPTGVLTAVGPAAAIHSSTDAVNWTRRAPPDGFTADLHAIANYTANPNQTAGDPGLRTIAVGAGGAALISTDGSATWAVGQPFDAGRATLRGIVAVGTTFVAVGDGGTIRSTADAVTWNDLVSNTTANLNAIGFGTGRYVAVGDGGVLVDSINDGVTWTPKTIEGAGSLRAIAYGNSNNNVDNGGVFPINTFVAVGDGGKAVVSTDGGANWTVKTLDGAGDLIGIAYISRFVAIDRAGNAFTSTDGQTWSSAIATGASGLRAIVTNGYGYIAVGDGGVTTTSF